MESFRQKLAHNSRVSLGPRDIKLLQECITSERKLVDQAQRLAAERDKASHALREWAGAEGPDLNDVVSKVCTLYDYLSKAEMAYAEHNGNYRIRFKEIRSKEETLAGLKKSRDSLGGRIEAQDRKVSKMKEENKDLPAQKQRLRDMQQEMVGLEHSVLTEETRLGDFKRAATRAALSLKLGAMLELAEKTVIIAELGKLMVDMLPTDETEPGQPRAYYDGYSRTEELLSEAQRCLQDVVFNPAPITEGFAAQHPHGGGGGYATDTYRSQLGHGDPSQPGYGDGYDEAGGIRPVGGADSSNEYGSQTPAAAAAHYRDEPSYGSYSSPYEQPSHSSVAGADAGAPEGSLRHGPGPRLQPLPDFRPISSFQPMGDDATSQWSDARRQPYHQQPESAAPASVPTATPVHDAFASSSARTGPPPPTTAAENTPASPSTALAPPITDLRSSVDRSSLAYMGTELEHDHDAATTSQQQQQYAHEETLLDAGAAGSDHVEAREAAQAREDAERSQHTVGDGVGNSSDAYEAAMVSPSVYTRQTHGEGPTPTEEYHPTPLPAAGGAVDDAAVGGQQQNPLSPIVEVATPAMTQLASPDLDQERRDFRSSDYAHQGQGVVASQDSSAVVPNSSSYDQYSDQRRRSYTPTAMTAAAAGSYPPSYATGAAASTNAPSDAALYNGEYSQQQPRARQVSAERQSARVASPTPYGGGGGGLPDVPSSPAGATSSFEPRPLGSSRFAPAGTGGDPYAGQRRPIQIRAPGSESSNGPLGSKYGDLQVGGSPLYAPSSTGSPSGGNSNEQKRTLPAGAFRRPPPPQVGGGGGPASPGIGTGGGGGRQFSASGYQYDPAAQQQQATPDSSESAAIAQRWRDSSIPPLSAEQKHELEQAGEGELPPISTTTTATPSFDVRPLQVNRAQNCNAPRSGSVPPTFDAAHLRSSSYGGNPAAPHDQGHSSSVYGGGAPNASAGANGQDGFGSNRFVTRLD